jgi:anti-sigma factor RsiW
MKCGEVLKALSDYVDDEVDADRGDEIDIHLEACPTCKGFLNTFQRTLDFCRDTAIPPLPQEERESLRKTAREAYLKAVKDG